MRLILEKISIKLPSVWNRSNVQTQKGERSNKSRFFGLIRMEGKTWLYYFIGPYIIVNTSVERCEVITPARILCKNVKFIRSLSVVCNWRESPCKYLEELIQNSSNYIVRCEFAKKRRRHDVEGIYKAEPVSAKCQSLLDSFRYRTSDCFIWY